MFGKPGRSEAEPMCTCDPDMRHTGDRTLELERAVHVLRQQLAKAESALASYKKGTGGQAPWPTDALPADHQSSLEAFRLLVEHMSDGVLMLTADGAIRYCNEAVARLLGLPKNRILGRSFGEFVLGEPSHFLQRLVLSDSDSMQTSLRTLSGTSVPVQISRTRSLTIDGQTLYGLVVTDLSRHVLRLRHEAVVQASKDAIYVLSPSLQIETWNRGAETIFGYSPSEIIGKSERDLCPRSELPALDDLVRRVQESGAAVTVDATRRRKDGSKIRVILSLTPIRELVGRTIGYAVVAHDVTERDRAARQLREAMARTSLALAAGRMGTYELDFATNRCSWSDHVYAIYGLDKATFEPTIENTSALIHPDDRELIWQNLEAAKLSGSLELEARVRHQDGRYIWIHSRGLVRYDAQGNPQAIFGVIADITERKEAERRQQLLVGELNHRVRNTLATVQAIASQTLRRAKSPDDFVPSFSERIQALSRAHTLLTRTAWQGTELDALIREQLMLGSADRISCEGPQVALDPQTALQLALVLHELGTNARKYGSLSVPQGTVDVHWTLEQAGGSSVLHLTWRERGGPPVTPPASTGFGTLLIERSLQQAQGGSSRISYDPEGVTCAIRLPLSPSDAAASAQQQSA